MAATDILRTGIAAAFAEGVNPLDVNTAGGYNVWSVPAVISRAYNPMIFRRDEFMHRVIGAWEPTQPCKPNYAKIDGTDIVFDYATATALVLVVTGEQDGEDKTESEAVPVGTSVFALSDHFSTISRIDSIGFYGYEQGDYCADASYIYVREGYAYVDEDFICNADGRVLYRDWLRVEPASVKFVSEYGRAFTLTATSHRGTALYDASSVVRHWFAKTPAPSGSVSKLVLDRALFVRYRVKSGDYAIGVQFLAVKAVAQVGQSEEMNGYAGRVLTTLPELKLYDGFPFDYAMLAGADEVELQSGVTIPPYAIARVCFREDTDYMALQDEDGVDILTEAGETILLMPDFDIPVRLRCVPLRPLYVRWVNALGGLDYYMFAKRQTRKPQVSSSSVMRPFVESNAQSRTNIVPYGVKTGHELTCGAEGLTREEHRSLEWLPFSPYIEYWDADLSKWIRLTVNKYSGDLDSWEMSRDIEITFALPEINTQF